MKDREEYKTILNKFWHKGCTKDWLKGYVQCLYEEKKITFRDSLYLTVLVEQCKR